MSSFPQHSTPAKANTRIRHDTVNCHSCDRHMVPRLASYYGHHYKSVCPFCGTTFARFPSGFHRLFQPFQSRDLSWVAFYWLLAASLSFGLLGAVLDWLKISNNIVHYAELALVSIGLVILAMAELFVQVIERLATKLSHESNYYWAVFVLAIVSVINIKPQLMDYLWPLSLALLARWMLVGVVRAVFRDNSREPLLIEIKFAQFAILLIFFDFISKSGCILIF